MSTGSIPHRSGITGLNGAIPVPDRDVAGNGAYNNNSMSEQPLVGENEALNQPYPGPVSNGSYSGAQASGARMASAPVSVQRSELASPGAATRRKVASEREVALAQPFPASRSDNVLKEPGRTTPDPVVTGTTSSSGWSTFNAPTVRLKPGESIATLSNRYGVPEKEILKANGLKKGQSPAAGQAVIIPTFGKPRNLAKATAEADVPLDKQKPVPGKTPEREAVLPGTATSRDKGQVVADGQTGKQPVGDGKPPAGKGGSYVVKSGDSLAKIAKSTGTPIADLKAANGITTGSIRIGQTLKLPTTSTARIDTATVQPDMVKTGALPTKKVSAKPVETASIAPDKKPESYKAPVATESVAEVEKKSDNGEDAPDGTGIGKYRWPVKGAVIANYGDNVEGSRNDGIDISVPEGTAIKSAENGVVIYAGNGLKELGNTVLVRHEDGRVTVYGHADQISVARGQKVQRGQTLATSGMSGNAKRPQVHFEVRKDATPVNPMTYLQ